MAGRASIVGAAATHVGKVRDHNEDAHFFDADGGMFLVCDGMGGHAAGEVASALAIQTIRAYWNTNHTQKLIDAWLTTGTPETKKLMLASLRDGVVAAHDAILAEAAADEAKSGMGTTLVGAMVVGNELVFVHAGDSRAYLVRDAIAMQLTEDHTLLSRLLAAGIEVDVSGEGARFRSMLTNALGIGNEVKVATFVVPLADGDRFMFCSDGISEYVREAEVGEVLTKQPSPARAAQKLIELALERGGGDNCTAIVMKVLEAGDSPQPAETLNREQAVIAQCSLWGDKVTPQQRLRALRIAMHREYPTGERVPAATLGDRVAWILVEGKLAQDGELLEPGALVYPESLVRDSRAPDRDRLAVARTDVRVLGLRADDFHEVCEDDAELGEALLESLQPLLAKRRGGVVPERADAVMGTVSIGDLEPDAAVLVGKGPETHVEASTQQPAPSAIESIEDVVKNLGTTVDESFEAAMNPVVARTPTPQQPMSSPKVREPLFLKPKIDMPKPSPRESKIVPAVDPSNMFTPPKPLPAIPPSAATAKPGALPPLGAKLPPLPSLKVPAAPPQRRTDPAMPPPAVPAVTMPAATRSNKSRPPSEPDIETEYEMEAEAPPDAKDVIDDLEAPEVVVIEGPPSEPRTAAGRAKRTSDGWED